jgi:hypothetical protein
MLCYGSSTKHSSGTAVHSRCQWLRVEFSIQLWIVDDAVLQEINGLLGSQATVDAICAERAQAQEKDARQDCFPNGLVSWFLY